MATVLLVPHSETFLVFEQQKQVLHFMLKLFCFTDGCEVIYFLSCLK